MGVALPHSIFFSHIGETMSDRVLLVMCRPTVAILQARSTLLVTSASSDEIGGV